MKNEYNTLEELGKYFDFLDESHGDNYTGTKIFLASDADGEQIIKGIIPGTKIYIAVKKNSDVHNNP